MVRRKVKVSNTRTCKVKKVLVKNPKRFSIIDNSCYCWNSDDLRDLQLICRHASFVKIFPPANTSNQKINSIKTFMFNVIGVDAVKVMPRSISSRLVSSHKKSKKEPVRKTVINYAKDIKNSVDKKLLITTLNKVMDKVGL